MSKKKLSKKRIATSRSFLKGQEPVLRTKVIRRKKKYPVVYNLEFRQDMDKFNLLFKNKMPVYFVKLRNKLKNKNQVADIFHYAMLYINKTKTIKEIDDMQFTIKAVQVPIVGARIAHKK
jgi:hypothetical protein